MKAFVTDSFALPLPAEHRFPVAKYRLLRQRVDESGLFAPEDFIVPAAASMTDLLRVHTPDYLQRLLAGALSEPEIRRIGFPWSAELVERSRRTTGGTVEAALAAKFEGIAVNLAGGTHHAFADAGEGFCLFNDVMVAARRLQQEKLADRIVIIDCDVHQGNGTAVLAQGDESIFTFSIHGAKNFPLRKEKSDLDVELPDATRDQEYLAALEPALFEALIRARADFAFYLSGADAFEGDRLGRLKVSKNGLLRRDRLVLDALNAASLPTAVCMGGGYAEDVRDAVDIYFQTVRTAAEMSARWGKQSR
jgi:acetoin utilization deacetylase AcuC-like enzyme